MKFHYLAEKMSFTLNHGIIFLAGREVDWVQCDGGCNKWYHMYCVGLVKNQIKADEDFVCKKCKKASKTLADAKDNCDKTTDDATPNKPTEVVEDDPDGTKNQQNLQNLQNQQNQQNQSQMEIPDTDDCLTKQK